jgi:arsenite methyltransferase
MAQVKTLEDVKNYYGRVLSSSSDLKTSACCLAETLPKHLRPLVSAIHPEILQRFYGCGSPIPSELKDCTVVDLGCGTGRDAYVLSKLVGEKGQVIGVDMTSEQLEVARRHQDYHAKLYGYAKSNVRFVQGYIEDLEGAGVASESVDVVVSNCVLNLSPDKERVFREIFRVLKPGGELYFSDVFTGRRVPEPLKQDPVLLGECLSGALYIEDFRRILAQVGCADYRVLSKTPIELTDEEVSRKIGMVDFYSMTMRAFKLNLEDRCEDFGQVAYYLGTISEAPHAYVLDDHHTFKTGMPVPVCSNTAAMLASTRLQKHFKVTGDTSVHYGLFDCAPVVSNAGVSSAGGACC